MSYNFSGSVTKSNYKTRINLKNNATGTKKPVISKENVLKVDYEMPPEEEEKKDKGPVEEFISEFKIGKIKSDHTGDILGDKKSEYSQQSINVLNPESDKYYKAGKSASGPTIVSRGIQKETASEFMEKYMPFIYEKSVDKDPIIDNNYEYFNLGDGTIVVHDETKTTLAGTTIKDGSVQFNAVDDKYSLHADKKIGAVTNESTYYQNTRLGSYELSGEAKLMTTGAALEGGTTKTFYTEEKGFKNNITIGDQEVYSTDTKITSTALKGEQKGKLVAGKYTDDKGTHTEVGAQVKYNAELVGVELSNDINVYGLDMKMTGKAYFGAGFTLNIGFVDGKLELGAGIGAGVGLEFGSTLDFNGLAKNIANAFDSNAETADFTSLKSPVVGSLVESN